MAKGRPRTGTAASVPAVHVTSPAAASTPNGNGPAKAYRHKGEKRRNIPPAAIAAEGRVPAAPELHYSYSPRLDPVLRFDSSGAPDKLPDLLEKAKREPLTEAEPPRASMRGSAVRANSCRFASAHNWADWPATKRSYELMARYVHPHFQRNSNELRNWSYDDAKSKYTTAGLQSKAAVQAAIDTYQRRKG